MSTVIDSFYPHAVKIWNEIGPDLRQAVSLSSFKMRILKIIRPPKRSIFNIHDPIAMKQLFQLRVGLSPLRHHKKRHNFQDTPVDKCKCLLSAETTDHFLLHCNIYTEVRLAMFQKLNPILEANNLNLQDLNLVDLLLYGSDVLSWDTNRAILSATLEFIQNSKRFDM